MNIYNIIESSINSSLLFKLDHFLYDSWYKNEIFKTYPFLYNVTVPTCKIGSIKNKNPIKPN